MTKKKTDGPRRSATINRGTIVPRVTDPPCGISHSLTRCSTAASAIATPISATVFASHVLSRRSIRPILPSCTPQKSNRQLNRLAARTSLVCSPRQHYLDRVRWVGTGVYPVSPVSTVFPVYFRISPVMDWEDWEDWED